MAASLFVGSLLSVLAPLCAGAGRVGAPVEAREQDAADEGWSERYELPEGFRVERASDDADTYVAIAFDPTFAGTPAGLRGGSRALISRERGGLAWFEDRDGDGTFDQFGEYCDGIRACQGMAWRGGILYASGAVDGRLGVYRLTPDTSGRGVRLIELVVPVEGGINEHGPHGLAFGADGMLYLVLGDHVRIETEPRGAFPLLSQAHSDKLDQLTVLLDPNGHGHGVTYPGGYVARIDPATGDWDYHSVGYRNAYDLAFDADGELFTYDSDMEWDVGLPWYRPTRFVHAVPGGDYGWRKGSAVWPDYYFDVVPPALEAGRGSPTGVAYCDSAAYPARLRDTFFAGDWTEGEILVFRPRDEGAGHRGEVETIVRTDAGLPVTDMAFGPNGDLYFVSGGRGTIGRVERLTYGGEVEPPSLRPHRQRTWVGRAVTPQMLGSADPVVVRRALESLIFEPGCPPDLSELVLGRLRSADPWIRFAAYQVVRKHGLRPEGGLEAVAPPARFLLAAALAEGQPVWGPGPTLSDDETLDFLRCQQILWRSAEAGGAPDYSELFPHRDRRVSRELALLFGVERPEGWLEPVLAALEAEPEREQQIHYALCLTAGGGDAPPTPWTDSQARRMLRWFDEAETWTGGASFGGYLADMRGRLVQGFDAERKLALALQAPKKERLGLRSVAHFASTLAPEEVDALVPAIQYGWAQARDEDRSAALRLLAGVRAPKLLAFLRRQGDNPDAPRDEVLVALTRSAEEQDWARFVEGLDATSRETAAACAEALSSLERTPDTSTPYRTALDLARRHGAKQGRPFAELFARWSDTPLPADLEAEWDSTLGAFERWGSLRFPEFRRAPVDDTRKPRWSFESTLGFLRSSADRPGSPERGAEIYRRATCSSCHVVGERSFPELTGFGPDLYGVSSRFPLEGLLESIWFPSKSIAGLYRTSVATTSVGLRIEGRVISEDDSVVVLKKSDGTPVTLEWSVIDSLEESDLSTMPEGLLDPLTQEEVKDLFAYLASDGAAEGPGLEPDWTPLFDEQGRNLWEGDESLWKIRGGVLIGRSRGDGLDQSAYIVSKTRFGDFELEFDVRFTDGIGNGGLQYRSSVRTDRNDPFGYQADVGDVHWGELYATDGRGLLAGPEPGLWRELVDRDGWNHVHVRVEGDRHLVEVNGTRTVDHRDAAFTLGVLAFQLHAGPATEVRYANARIRILD